MAKKKKRKTPKKFCVEEIFEQGEKGVLDDAQDIEDKILKSS